MATISVLFVLLSLILLPIATILLIIQTVRKRPIKKFVIALLIIFITFAVSTIIGITESHEHEWIDATCVSPKTCSTCGKIENEPLGHNWKEATCAAPQTCSLCNETEGNALAHIPGEWVVEDPNFGAGYFHKVRHCTLCNAETDNELTFFSSLHEDGHFLFTPKEFASRLNSVYKVLGYGMTTNIKALDDNTLACGILHNGDVIAAILFNNDLGEMDGDAIDDRDLSSMMVYYYTNDVEDVVPAMLGIMIACDPKLEQNDASNLGKQIVNASLTNDHYEYHEIKYALTIINGDYLFVVSVLEK